MAIILRRLKKNRQVKKSLSLGEKERRPRILGFDQ